MTVMVDIAILVLVYLLGSSVNTALTLASIEKDIASYKEGWDYIILIVTFLFWPVVAITTIIGMPFWAYKGFKHPIDKPRP